MNAATNQEKWYSMDVRIVAGPELLQVTDTDIALALLKQQVVKHPVAVATLVQPGVIDTTVEANAEIAEAMDKQRQHDAEGSQVVRDFLESVEARFPGAVRALPQGPQMDEIMARVLERLANGNPLVDSHIRAANELDSPELSGAAHAVLSAALEHSINLDWEEVVPAARELLERRLIFIVGVGPLTSDDGNSGDSSITVAAVKLGDAPLTEAEQAEISRLSLAMAERMTAQPATDELERSTPEGKMASSVRSKLHKRVLELYPGSRIARPVTVSKYAKVEEEDDDPLTSLLMAIDDANRS